MAPEQWQLVHTHASIGESAVSVKQQAMHAKVMPTAKRTRAVHIGCLQPKAIGTRQGLTRFFTLTDRVPRVPRVPGSTATIDMNYFFHIATCLGRPTASDWLRCFCALADATRYFCAFAGKRRRLAIEVQTPHQCPFEKANNTDFEARPQQRETWRSSGKRTNTAHPQPKAVGLGVPRATLCPSIISKPS